MENLETTVIVIPESVPVTAITGCADSLLHVVQDAFSSSISMKGNEVCIAGTNTSEREAIVTLFSELIAAAQKQEELSTADLSRLIAGLKQESFSPKALRDDVILTHRGRSVRPKTSGQKEYIDAIRAHTITFGIGPAGTGKTYLAMAMAVAAFEQKMVSRIVLSRPIVEAGENLGFLPGSLTEKVDPYIRPLYDSLFDMMNAERASGLIERGVIEIAPLAFMRGRTLHDSFVILDEAQNATPEQMKMFLTRLGESSKMIITGDTSQSDLPRGAQGLQEATRVLEGIEDIGIVRLQGHDVVRNSLVAKIIAAYEKDSDGQSSKK